MSAEQLISLIAAVIIHLTVVRVVRGLSIAVLFGMVLFAGHVFYTFPGRHFWLMLDLALLSAVGLIGVRLLFTLERDEILSALWSTRPNALGLSSGLVLRGLGYAAVPLLTLFSVTFPEAGGGIIKWLEPVSRALPSMW